MAYHDTKYELSPTDHTYILKSDERKKYHAKEKSPLDKIPRTTVKISPDYARARVRPAARFCFQYAEKRLRTGIIITTTFSAHTLHYLMPFKHIPVFRRNMDGSYDSCFIHAKTIRENRPAYPFNPKEP